MPHGKPDWGVDWTPRTVRGLEDLGEHAVRLGSPHLWDRRGDVLWMTDFRNGMGDIQGGVVGALSAVQLWTERSRQGAYAVNLFTDADGGDEAHLIKYLPLPVTSRIGIEFSFSLGANTGSIEAWIWWRNGTNFWYGALRYDRPNDRLRYESPGGVWNDLGTNYNLWLDIIPCHSMKLVIDVAALRYVRAILDDLEYTIPVAVPPVTDTLVPMGVSNRRQLEIGIYHFTDGTGTEDSFIDNVIVTHNEP